MLQVIVANLILLASAQEKAITNIYKSQKQTKELLAETIAKRPNNVPNDFKMSLTWFTQKEMYDDGKDADFFMGQLNLVNLQTVVLEGEEENKRRDEIRATIGIRNPEEDAYDLTSFSIQYGRDINWIKYQCIDGYSNGTYETEKYKVNGNTVKDSKGQPVDEQGRRNITIKKWTDELALTNKQNIYRLPEVNDCELIKTIATERIDWDKKEKKQVNRPQGVPEQAVKQNFTIYFRKPLKTKEIQDFSIKPGKSYNVTAYFGCYKDEQQENRYAGDNPDKHWKGEWGCRQIQMGKKEQLIYYTDYKANDQKITYYEEKGFLPTEITIKILKQAQTLAATAIAVVGLAVTQLI